MVVGAVNRTKGGVIFGEGCVKGACTCFPTILPRLSRTYPKVVGVTSRNRDTALYTMEAFSYNTQQSKYKTDASYIAQTVVRKLLNWRIAWRKWI